MTNQLSNEKEISTEREKLKTIYYAWNYLEWGGAQIYFLGLMRSVAEKYLVKAVLPYGSDEKILKYLQDNNVQYEFFEGHLDSTQGGTVWRRIKRRWSDFRTNISFAGHFSKYDLKNSIVHLDVAPWSSFALLLYLTLRTNVFVTLHTGLPELSSLRRFLWQIKFAILERFKNFHLAASNIDVKKSLRRYVRGKSYEQIQIVYSSVNLNEINSGLRANLSRREIAERYDFPPEKIWICNVAQFIDRKGCWVFLDTIKKLQSERNDLFFFWLGTLPLSEEIKIKIENYNLGNDFRFLSAAETGSTRNDLLNLWQAADLFVLPSFQEGLPVALIEAMALGKACIASDVNAIPEAVEHLETGVLVNAGNVSQLAEAMNSLANDSVLREKLGENARKFVSENFEEKTTGQKMLGLYEKITWHST